MAQRAADGAALGDALHRCLDPARADDQRAMRVRARETALRRFSPDAYFERLREAVEATLG